MKHDYMYGQIMYFLSFNEDGHKSAWAMVQPWADFEAEDPFATVISSLPPSENSPFRFILVKVIIDVVSVVPRRHQALDGSIFDDWVICTRVGSSLFTLTE